MLCCCGDGLKEHKEEEKNGVCYMRKEKRGSFGKKGGEDNTSLEEWAGNFGSKKNDDQGPAPRHL
jgi:hypothetical protein